MEIISKWTKHSDSWNEFLKSLSTNDLVKLVLSNSAYRIGASKAELNNRTDIPDKMKLEMLLIGLNR